MYARYAIGAFTNNLHIVSGFSRSSLDQEKIMETIADINCNESPNVQSLNLEVVETAINYSNLNNDDRFQKLIIVSYSGTQSNTDPCIYADDLLCINIETFVDNDADYVDANALECLTNDQQENLQTTEAIDEEELNDVVYAIFDDICESSDGVTNEPPDLPTVSPTPSHVPTDATTRSPTPAPTGEPTHQPSSSPTDIPTDTPTDNQTPALSNAPTNAPTDL